MNIPDTLPLVVPRVVPELDPGFRPAVLANRAWRQLTRLQSQTVPVRFALEQKDGSVSRHATEVLAPTHVQAAANFHHLERLLKFLLWSRGGGRIHFDGPAELGAALQKHYAESPTGRFDSEIVGSRIYDQPITVVSTHHLPEPRNESRPLGRHLEGCRIGFDLGGSDRKAAALIDGEVVFSEEIEWDPMKHSHPRHHIAGITESLKRAAAHLPRVDAIGGSAAGVYVNNQVKVASLFRGIPPEAFETGVRDMFLLMQEEWGVPFDVVNDGEVTALAGSMALGVNGVLGLAMGTSMAGGYVNRKGHITSWLNELAFVPVDYQPDAPADEWSGDRGCGVQYFSQQAVARLMEPAGIEADASLAAAAKLKQVQVLMTAGDERARRIYRTIGAWLGYAVAHFSEFYDFDHVLVLGRVSSGAGGDEIARLAAEVLRVEFPELAARIRFHLPGEREKRHGQAIAAASLPELKSVAVT